MHEPLTYESKSVLFTPQFLGFLGKTGQKFLFSNIADFDSNVRGSCNKRFIWKNCILIMLDFKQKYNKDTLNDLWGHTLF